MQIKRYAVVLVLMLTTLLSLCATAQEGVTSHAAPDLPPYIRIMADGCEVSPTYTPDSVFYRIAGQTIFKVNRTALRPDDPFIAELTDSVLPAVNSSGWKLVAVDLRGAASPEGPYYNNQRLSRGRAQTLLDYLRQHLDSVEVREVYTTTVAEDYAYLLYLLERDGDSAAVHLRRIIERHGLENPQAIKRDMQALYNGTYWARLLRDYFPRLRSARIVLYFQQINPRHQAPDASLATMTTVPVQPDYTMPEAVLWSPAHEIERPHFLSVSTNALYDMFYMPQFGFAPMWNVGLEWFPRNCPWTLRAHFTNPYYQRWSKHKFFQIRDYSLEVRRYFHPGKLHTGLYAGAYSQYAKYGIGLSEKKGWQGEGWGAGLKLGYVMPLGSGRWRVDFHISAGGFTTDYDPYVYGNPVTGEQDDYYYDWSGSAADFRRRNHRFTWLGPTEIGITFSYDLLYYRVSGKGVSTKRKEVVY